MEPDHTQDYPVALTVKFVISVFELRNSSLQLIHAPYSFCKHLVLFAFWAKRLDHSPFIAEVRFLLVNNYGHTFIIREYR